MALMNAFRDVSEPYSMDNEIEVEKNTHMTRRANSHAPRERVRARLSVLAPRQRDHVRRRRLQRARAGGDLSAFEAPVGAVLCEGEYDMDGGVQETHDVGQVEDGS
jgi:hypothetical protein